MRILVAATAAIVMLGSANAQSLEESYAKLCPQPAVENVEACSALQQALKAKQGQGQQQPRSTTSKSREAPSVADPTWGPLAQLANTAWGVGIPGSSTMALVDRFAWIEDGTAVRFTSELPGMPAALTEIVFRPGPDPGTLSAVIQYQSEQTKVLFRFNEDVLVSDWYLTVSGNISNRQEIRLTGDGQYESRKAQDMSRKPSDPVDGPDFTPLHGQYKRYSESGIAQLEAQSRGVGAAIERQAAEQVAAEQRAAKVEKAARRSERAAMFGAVLQGLAQGVSESNTVGYAEAQADLDATVANIQYAADVERQQQALAAQQEQVRAAEANRQQLAENARWVAEKEQAAAEYRAGQVEAAAAREVQLQEQQQANDQRRAAAEVQRRNAEQTATLERQRLQAQAAASTDNAARGGGSPQAGGSLQVEAVAQSPRADSMPSDPNAVRQMLLACFLVHHGDFDQGKGAVFFSSTVPVTVERGKPYGGDPTGTFRRKVKSSYNKDGGTGCQTFNDAAEVQRYMQDVATSHRGHKKIDTGISPLD